MPFQFTWIARRRNSAGDGAAGSANAGGAARRPSRPSPALSRSSLPWWSVTRTGSIQPTVGSLVGRGGAQVRQASRNARDEGVSRRPRLRAIHAPRQAKRAQREDGCRRFDHTHRPRRAATGNPRLRPDSPLVDIGIDAPDGGMGTFDADGLARVRGVAVEVGAFEREPDASEYDLLFADGFESTG